MVDTANDVTDRTAPFRHSGGQPCYGCQSCFAEFDDNQVAAVHRRVQREMGRFLRTAPDGEIVYSPFALAVLVTEILTEHTTVVQTERDEAVRECARREADILDVIGERDRLEARLAELHTATAGGR